MHQVHCLILAAVSFLLAGCASRGSQTALAQVRESGPVDPIADNRIVVGQLMPGLVMQLHIDHDAIRLSDPKLILVPRQPPDPGDGEKVVVSGWRDGERVTTTAIPDQRINAQENAGTVILEQRTLHVALPTPRRIDVVEVAMPGIGEPRRFSVAFVYDRVCRGKPRLEFCR